MIEPSFALVLACALIVFGGFVVRGMSGFGLSLVTIPMLVLFIPIRAAVPLMSMLGLFLLLFLGLRDWRHVIWREVWMLFTPTMIGVLAGLYLFKRMDSLVLVRVLGAFIIAYALYALAAQHYGLKVRRCSWRWAWPAGFLSSFVDTVFGGGGGTIGVLYMHSRGVTGVEFRATLAVVWVAETLLRLVGYAEAGYYDRNMLMLVALLLPLMFAGTLLGERIERVISRATFTRVFALLLIASGATLLVK